MTLIQFDKGVNFNFLTCWSVSWPECIILLLSLSIGAKIALPLINLISFVGGSFCSRCFAFDTDVVNCVGVMHADGTEFVMTGDDDLFNFVSLLQNTKLFMIFFRSLKKNFYNKPIVSFITIFITIQRCLYCRKWCCCMQI